MRGFIDKHRDTFRVEPVCKVLSVAPSAYRRHAALLHEPHQRCARAKRDEVLMPEIERVWQANMLGDMLKKLAKSPTLMYASASTVVHHATIFN